MVYSSRINFVRVVFCMAICLIFVSSALAQPSEEWVQIYDSPDGDDDEGWAMAVDNAGDVYVAGYSTNSEGYDQWHTIKYDTNGVEQWTATHSGTGGDDDYAYAIVVDANGNVYVTGSAYNTGTRSDLATIKYNSNGVEQWVAVYNGSGNDNDCAYDIAVDGSGNVFVTGYSISTSGYDDCVTIMYDASGTEQWVNIYNGTGNERDWGSALVVDGSSNVFVTGMSENAAGNRDGLTIMYDSTGAQQWLNLYDGDFHGSDNTRDITLDGLGNVVVVGVTEITQNNYRCLTIKYNSSGVEQWTTIYNGVEDEGASGTCIVSDGLGNTYVGGDSRSLVTGKDFCTIKYDSSGVSQWVATYNGPDDGHENVIAITLDGYGNVYVTGDVETPSTDYDWATVMYDSQGIEQWTGAYNGDADDFDRPYALAADGSGNLFVTGYSYDASGYVNCVTIKYALDTVGTEEGYIDPEQNNTPQPVVGLSVFPNPFNPCTKVSFTLEHGENVNLSIYDITGKCIAVLADGTFEAGAHSLDWQGKDLQGQSVASGTYFARMTTTDKMVSTKMMLVR
ncbi:MAG: T9SS type A sorting domain-containing protein [bacterium]|nr:T9SS type A sorting domain-containing protein [bacterium]